jgi:NAD(P)-dependent dehydrogenase (short-subunit alcohol dehydrogenase family)
MKHYVVIGGSSGIGAALSHSLAQDAQVFASFYQKPKESKDNIVYFPLNILEAQLDFSMLPDAIDGIVYCPGSINLKPFNRIKTDDFLQDYQLQVIGAIKVIQALLPRLKQSTAFPSILLFSTIAVQVGFNFHSLVSSSKGAIEGLAKALAAEFAPTIRVNVIAPSITDTPLAGSILGTADKKEANAQRHPLKKIGQPEDVASLAAFLLSDNAKWITGQIFHIDGGMSSLKV